MFGREEPNPFFHQSPDRARLIHDEDLRREDGDLPGMTRQ